MSTSLFVLAQEYRDAAEKLSQLDLDDATISDTLEGLSGALEVKATNVAMFVRNIESLAEQIKAAEEDMKKRRTALENRAERIRHYVMTSMQSAGITKIECPYFKIAIQDNPESVVVDDEKQIPRAYFIEPPPPEPRLDKTLVKKAIKDGFTVNVAHLERTKRLVIK